MSDDGSAYTNEQQTLAALKPPADLGDAFGAMLAEARAAGVRGGMEKAAGIAVSVSTNESMGGPKTDMRTSIYVAIRAAMEAT